MSERQCRKIGLTGKWTACASVFVSSVAMLTALGAMPSAAHAELLTAFDHDPVVSTAELGKLRGGFELPGGALIQFGFQMQQYVNHVLQDTVSTSPITIGGGVVQPSFSVTQTDSNGHTVTTPYNQLPPGGIQFKTATDGGQISVNINNGSVQTLIQNSANNQALQSVTTINIATQGLVNVLHSAMSTAQIMNTIQTNSWLQH